MSERTILVWFRNDLRIHDNEILFKAVKKADKIIPVFCFDPRNFSVNPFGTYKTGSLRAKFILESVQDLKESLKALGGDLMIVSGKPEEILPAIAQKYKANEVYHHREVASDETEISALVEAALWKLQINLKHFIGHTLYHKEDLPFPIKDIPDAFATFRKKIERESQVRPCFDTPERITIPDNFEPGVLPSLSDLKLVEQVKDERAVLEFTGGESEGLKRIKEFFWEKEQVNNYNVSRSSLVRASYSSKLSPWLSLGCLSTRQVFWEIKKHERQNSTSNASSKLAVEFLWRDYYRFMYKKYGTKFYPKSDPVGKNSASQQKSELFEKWKNAETGFPFIDACMRELNSTGYLSNIGRQCTASFLINNLKINWELGAAYFEEKLIDYSPASNWGNWAFVAGLTNNQEKKTFDILKQSQELNPQGEYVNKWIPK